MILFFFLVYYFMTNNELLTKEKEQAIAKLNELGWFVEYENSVQTEWRYEDTNRYVDIEFPNYIDCYCYSNEGKYKGYFTLEEWFAFSALIKCMLLENIIIEN